MAILSYNVTIQDWYSAKAYIDYSVTYDPITNKSTVTFKEVTHSYYGDSGWYTESYTNITVKATDSGATATASCGTSGTTDGWKDFYLTPSPKTVTVQHSQTAGKKTITISGYSNYYPTHINGNPHGPDGSGSVTIEVGEYYPASTLTVSNGTLGVSQTLEVGRLIDSFTHTITYSCGTFSGTICEKSSDTVITWTPPIALAGQNTNGTSVAVQFTITTYTGATVLGTNTVPITCAIPESVKPSFTVAVSDAMGYANNFGGYVQTKSKLKIVVDITTMYDATVASVKVIANGETHNTSDITTEALKNSGTNTITVEVIDSRGRKASGNTTVAVLAYSAPAISLMTYERCDSDGTDNPLGDNAEITFSSAVTSLSGKNAISYTMEYKKTSEVEYATVNMADFAGKYSVISGTRIFAADAGSSYDVRLTVSDSFGSAVATLVVDTGSAIMHWLPRGVGMAIGKIAEKLNTLELGWRIHMNGNRIEGLGNPVEDQDAVPLKVAKKINARNLLDNSDFRNPVNQRGQTSYTGNLRAIDRWYLWSSDSLASLTVEDDCIAINPGGTTFVSLSQRFPLGYFRGVKYTCAVCYDDGTISCSDARLYTHSGGWECFELATSSFRRIRWMALYEGEYTAETLPEYQPKGYGAELAECQRYWMKPVQTPVGYGYIHSTPVAICAIPLPVKMRVPPTITYDSLSVKYYNGTSMLTTPVTSHTIFELEANAIRINLYGEFTGAGAPCVVVATNLVLNAER